MCQALSRLVMQAAMSRRLIPHAHLMDAHEGGGNWQAHGLAMSSSSCDAPDPDSMLNLLHECKLEGEMLHQHIAARTHTRKQTSSALQERLEEIKRISEEILDIRCVPSNIPFLPFCIQPCRCLSHQGEDDKISWKQP